MHLLHSSWSIEEEAQGWRNLLVLFIFFAFLAIEYTLGIYWTQSYYYTLYLFNYSIHFQSIKLVSYVISILILTSTVSFLVVESDENA